MNGSIHVTQHQKLNRLQIGSWISFMLVVGILWTVPFADSAKPTKNEALTEMQQAIVGVLDDATINLNRLKTADEKAFADVFATLVSPTERQTIAFLMQRKQTR